MDAIAACKADRRGNETTITDPFGNILRFDGSR